ncbi:MAG: hypothetical protein WCK90_03780 [archaeon]
MSQEGLQKLITEAKMPYLANLQWNEETLGRHFSEKRSPMKNIRTFWAALEPNVNSPIHNHRLDFMCETHILVHGSGKFIIYDPDGKSARNIQLIKGIPHEVFSNYIIHPDHQYIAGEEGSICLAFEYHP